MLGIMRVAVVLCDTLRVVTANFGSSGQKNRRVCRLLRCRSLRQK